MTLSSDASVAMASFGENLRREREMRGVSLGEISASTRINVRFLQALEEDDFGKLPGGVFMRSFIRAYASYLGLDQEAVMAEFQTLAQPEAELDFNRLGTKPSPGSRGGRRPIVLWVVAGALLAGGWALYRYSHRATEQQSSRSEEATASSAPAAGSIAPANPATGTGSPTGVAPQTSGVVNPAGNPEGLNASNGRAAATEAASAPDASSVNSHAAPPSATSVEPKALGQGNLVLQVAATERVWLAVSADGKKIFQKTLDPNEVESFRATDSFDVTTGNAQGTVLTLNGETQKPLGRHGELKKIHLTRQNLPPPTP